METKDVTRKRAFAFAVLTLFVLSFSMSLVLAAEEETGAGSGGGGGSAYGTNTLDETFADAFNGDGPIRAWFTDWESGTSFSTNIAKYLFWALISMIVFSVGKNIPGLDSLFKKKGTEEASFIGIVFSLIVGFLSMAYITPEEVYAMMISYSALGYVLGGFLPMIILVYFTISIASGQGSAHSRLSRRMIATIMWVAYSGFTLIKAINAPEGSIALSWIMFGASVLMTVSVKPLIKKIWKELRGEKIQKMNETIDTADASIRAHARSAETLSK